MKKFPATLALLLILPIYAYGLIYVDITEEKPYSEVFKFREHYAYFADNGDCDMYYWTMPSFLDLDMLWGFNVRGTSITAIAKDGYRSYRGNITVDQEWKKLHWPGLVFGKAYSKSISPETKALLVHVWEKVLEKETKEKMGLDGERAFLGISVAETQQHGTYWSPDQFTLDHEFLGITLTIELFMFRDDSATEQDIQAQCRTLLSRSKNEHEEMMAEADRLHELIFEYIDVDPFILPEDEKKIPKALGEKYLAGYRKLLRHYYKDRDEAYLTRYEKYLIPDWREASNEPPREDPFAQ